jgi:hypothetical protein
MDTSQSGTRGAAQDIVTASRSEENGKSSALWDLADIDSATNGEVFHALANRCARIRDLHASH